MKKIKQSTTSSSTYLYNFVRPLLALRSTIRNAKSIHNKSRQRLTQDTYRRNSRRYLQQKGGRLASPRRNSKSTAKSPLAERKNQGKENICHTDMFPQQFVTSELICFVFYSVQNMENTSVHWCNKLPIKPPVRHYFVIYTPQTTSRSSLPPVLRASWRRRLRSSLPGRVQNSSWSAAVTTPARKSASGLAPAPPLSTGSFTVRLKSRNETVSLELFSTLIFCRQFSLIVQNPV